MILRTISFALTLMLASAAAYATGGEPSDHPTQTERFTPPAAPTSLSLVACRVDDLTGKPGRHGVDPVTGEFDKSSAAKGWRDLELHIVGGELECKVVPFENLEDSATYSELADASLVPLEPNFGRPAQCSHAAMMISPDWDAKNPGWSVITVGCPSPLLHTGPDGIKRTADDYIVGWVMPECPRYFPGTETRIKCRFTESMI